MNIQSRRLGNAGRSLTRVLIAALVVVVCTLMSVLVAERFWSQCERALSVFGLAFQLTGLLLIALGFSGVRIQFGVRGIIYQIVEWVSRTWRKIRPPAHRSFGAGYVGNGGGWSRSRSHALPNNPTVEERVEVAEKRLDDLNAELNRLDQSFRESVDSLRKALGSEQLTREAQDYELRQDVRGLATATVQFQVVGVVLIAIGVVLATIPTTLCEWL